MKVVKVRGEEIALKNSRWTAEEDTRIKDLRAAGLTIRAIAGAVKRTRIGVLERLKYLRRADRNRVTSPNILR